MKRKDPCNFNEARVATEEEEEDEENEELLSWMMMIGIWQRHLSFINHVIIAIQYPRRQRRLLWCLYENYYLKGGHRTEQTEKDDDDDNNLAANHKPKHATTVT